MDLQLGGRRALVTGSSSGIGEATARLLAGDGARVVIHGRDRARAERVAAEIGAAGAVVGDLASDEGAMAVHADACAALGDTIEILVNNAGGSPTGKSTTPAFEIDADAFVANYATNMLAAVRLCRLVLPDMIERQFGRIINVSSAVATQPNNMGADYSAAKAALNNYSVSLAGSLEGKGITVNTLQPGVVMADGLLRHGRSRFGDPDMTIEQVTRRLADAGAFVLPPVGRLGTPQDLALVACLLASPLSGFISGANYRVDGGMVRGVN